MIYLFSSFFFLIAAFSSLFAEDSTPNEKSKSLVESAPELLFLLNHSPYVYGLPGTDCCDFFSQTQLFCDWGGIRNTLVKSGIYIDIYSTTNFQGVTSGGTREVGVFSQSTDITCNIDTTQMNLWPGGLIHFSIQSRYGSGFHHENLTGTMIPPNGAWLYPVSNQDNVIAPTEYYVVQAFSEKLMVMVGKIDALYVADQNIFASNYRYQFINAAFQVNAIFGQYFNPVAWLGAILWQPNKHIRITTAIVDPYSSAKNFASKAFRNIGIFQEFDFTYDWCDLPGTFTAGWVWSNAPRIDLSNPLEFNLFSGAHHRHIGTRKLDSAYAFYGNFAQYILVTDDSATVAAKAKLSLPPRGIGFFGRLGGGPNKSNIISLFSNLGIGAIGPFDCRPLDQFGVAWYYSHVSSEFKKDIKAIILVLDHFGADLNPVVKDEQGIEAYYNFVISPAIQLTADFQHVWNPLKSDFIGHDHMTLFGARLQVSF